MTKSSPNAPMAPLLVLVAALAVAAPAAAASLEVRVRDGDGRPLANELVVLQALSTEADHRTSYVLRQRGLTRSTDSRGTAAFDDLAPGTYVVDVPDPRQPSLLRAAENPLAPAPRVSFFDADERLAAEIVLFRGIPVTALIELPDDAFQGFRAVFRHTASGRVLASPFPHDANRVARLLVPGVWELEVEPRPGYLLVGLERDRVPLPGHAAILDLDHEPGDTYVTWAYAAPSRLAGVVAEASGREPEVAIEATLVEPGPWYEAARERGGSRYERVTASVDPHTGRYEMVLPDGVWSVRPVGSLLISSEPETVELALAEGGAGRADFTVRLDDSAGERPLVVSVFDARRAGLSSAPVEVYAAGDLETSLRSGVTNRFGSVRLPGLARGDYLVVAGHDDHLEGRLELRDHDPDTAHRRSILVVLPPGAEIRVQARDPAGEPLSEVRLTVERLGDPPETALEDAGFLAAKQRRDAATDASGRASLRGFYPGTYRVRTRLGGQRATGSLILVGVPGGKLAKEIEVELTAAEVLDLEAREVPASHLQATLTCADDWTLPDAASARVLDARAAVPAQASPEETPLLALADAPLTGRGHDILSVGPLQQGVYRLALKPMGFDRWTWAFQTHDVAEAAEIQVGVDDKAASTVDLGLFQVECAPAVDLLPAFATGGDFPALREVGVEARILDPEADREIAPRPAVSRRDGRILLRGLPGGKARLEVTLTHAHFLPEPSLAWRIEMELERGSFREIVPEVEAIGGSIVVAAAAGSAAVFGPEGEVRRAEVRRGEAELPSLVPGPYRVELDGGSGAGKAPRVWSDVEVRAGETLRLDGRDR